MASIVHPYYVGFPFTLVPAAPLAQTLYVVVRYRDSYGIVSVNTQPYILSIGVGGSLIMNVIPPPENVAVYPKSNSMLRIMGEYPTRSLEKNPADKVKVWVDTDPEVDPATYTTEIRGEAFGFNFGAFAAGDYTINVALYRTADHTKSEVVTLSISVPASPDVPLGI